MSETINIDTNPYVHYNKINYDNYLKKHPFEIEDTTITEQIQIEYKRIAEESKARSKRLIEDSEYAKKIFGYVATFDALANSGLSPEEMEAINNAVTAVKEVSIEARTLKSVMNNQLLDQQMTEMANFLNKCKTTMDQVSSLDSVLMKYYLDPNVSKSMVKNLKSTFSQNFLSINQSALTSLEGIGKRIGEIEQAAFITGTNGNLTFSNEIVYYRDGKNGKQIPVRASAAVYGLAQRWINVLGGIGEGAAALAANKAVDEILEEVVASGKGKNVNITVSGVGGEQINGKTSKSDIDISVTELKDGVLVNSTIGISAKAQYKKTANTITTTFETTKLGNLLENINHQSVISYYLFNDLHHNKINQERYSQIARYIAAMNFDRAVSAAGLTGQSQVYFLQYLDTIIPIDQFYESLSMKASGAIKDLPTISIAGAAKVRKSFIGGPAYAREDKTPTNKSDNAWARSNAMLAQYRGLQAQLKFSS